MAVWGATFIFVREEAQKSDSTDPLLVESMLALGSQGHQKSGPPTPTASSPKLLEFGRLLKMAGRHQETDLRFATRNGRQTGGEDGGPHRRVRIKTNLKQSRRKQNTAGIAG